MYICWMVSPLRVCVFFGIFNWNLIQCVLSLMRDALTMRGCADCSPQDFPSRALNFESLFLMQGSHFFSHYPVQVRWHLFYIGDLFLRQCGTHDLCSPIRRKSFRFIIISAEIPLMCDSRWDAFPRGRMESSAGHLCPWNGLDIGSGIFERGGCSPGTRWKGIIYGHDFPWRDAWAVSFFRPAFLTSVWKICVALKDCAYAEKLGQWSIKLTSQFMKIQVNKKPNIFHKLFR